HGQCCNAADRRRQPSDRPLKPFVQNRHFVRPKVAVPFALHVYDEVAALTLPTWHQPGPVSPPRASVNAPFGYGNVGSTSRANPRVPSPWHETHPPAFVNCTTLPVILPARSDVSGGRVVTTTVSLPNCSITFSSSRLLPWVMSS